MNRYEKSYDKDEIVPRHEFQITEEMVTIANRQVAQVHNQAELPLPYSAVYHDWGEDPYGGGWHEWKANYRIDEILCRMRHPVPNQDIYIVGEAYSFDQGWVEGALDVAESTLEEFFKLPRPKWLADPSYPFLPNPCPGCPPLEGCVQCPEGGKSLGDLTPNCLETAKKNCGCGSEEKSDAKEETSGRKAAARGTASARRSGRKQSQST